MRSRKLRTISSEERYLRILLTEKFGRVSPKMIADKVSHMTKREIPRQFIDQVINGKAKTAWVREAIAMLLNKKAGEIWPEMKEPKTYDRSDMF